MRGGLATGAAGAERGGFATLSAMSSAARAATRPDALILLIAAVILTYVWRFQNAVPYGHIVRPALLLGLALAVMLVRVPFGLVLRRLASPVLAILALVLIIAAVGLPFALDPTGGTRYLTTWLLSGAVLAALVVIAVRSAADVEWLLFATLVAAAGYLAIVYARGGADAVTNPAATVFYDRNDLSLMLVALVPAALYFCRAGEATLRRVVAALCFLVFVFTIVRGGSRGGLVGLVVVLGYVLVTFRMLPRRARAWTAAAAIVLLAAGGPAYWARVRTILQPETDYNWSGRTYGRGEVWRRGLAYVRERPLTGVGAGGFPVAEGDLSPVARRRMMAGRPFETLDAHNIFLQVAAELGLPGLVAFVALLIQMARTLRSLQRQRRGDPRVPAVAQVLLGSLIAYVVCGFFLSAAYFPLFFLLIGLVGAIAATGGREPVTVPSARRVGPSARGAPGTQLPPYEVPAPARW